MGFNANKHSIKWCTILRAIMWLAPWFLATSSKYFIFKLVLSLCLSEIALVYLQSMSFWTFNWFYIFTLRYCANVHITNILFNDHLSLDCVSLHLWLKEKWRLFVYIVTLVRVVIEYLIFFICISTLCKNVLIEINVQFSIKFIELSLESSTSNSRCDPGRIVVAFT